MNISLTKLFLLLKQNVTVKSQLLICCKLEITTWTHITTTTGLNIYIKTSCPEAQIYIYSRYVIHVFYVLHCFNSTFQFRRTWSIFLHIEIKRLYVICVWVQSWNSRCWFLWNINSNVCFDNTKMNIFCIYSDISTLFEQSAVNCVDRPLLLKPITHDWLIYLFRWFCVFSGF